ncbi:threonine dehydratase catabolic [Microthyrium microscopicum]|uniref:Threonine dehydratase catabolic n=1 Tax=Microthyrium microscopicum TaxID=703497 RepID=A0A6A6TW70_9PEZI|nr:threonine dehydratase catabolic [Microthyrium microscopicum]
MAAIADCPPLTRESVQKAHEIVRKHVHLTPVVTNTTLNNIASTPQSADALEITEYKGRTPAKPKIRFFFKCENLQRIGAFKVRGAFHAISRLPEEVRRKGIVTHSSGNHAQATALAAKTFGIQAHVIMPKISTPSKVEATKALGANVHFSGSTAPEREAVTNKVLGTLEPGAVILPPYDHPDIILGQGTLALEFEQQVEDLGSKLDAVIGPCGGGGMLSGTATALHGTGIRVYGAEPMHEGANDAQRGLAQGSRITDVSTLTIADGLRTPLGEITWSVISDKEKVRGLFSVTEEQIKAAMKLLMERAKLFVEPSACVGLAVALFNEDFRSLVEKEAGEDGWNVGIILTGGNTTIDAIIKLFST